MGMKVNRKDVSAELIFSKLDAKDGTDGKITKSIWNEFVGKIEIGNTINYYITESNAIKSIKYYLTKMTDDAYNAMLAFIGMGAVYDDTTVEDTYPEQTEEQTQKTQNTQQEQHNTPTQNNNNETTYTKISDDEKYNVEDKADGYIDPTAQGRSGDCWLLSGLNALSETQWGRDAIKQAISIQDNGDIIVTLKGAYGKQKKFKISYHELETAKKSNKYSQGDRDVLAIELAVEKYRSQFGETLNGGQEEEILRLITGSHNTQKITSTSNMKSILQKAKANPEKYVITANFNLGDQAGEHKYHAYNISRFETDKYGTSWIILTNPWDSRREIRLTEADFLQQTYEMQVLANPNGTTGTPEIKSDGQIGTVKDSAKSSDYLVIPAILAVANTSPQIIKDSISKDNSGNIKVYLKGVGKTYTITPKEIAKANDSGKYTRGDDDVVALEIAMEKYGKEVYHETMGIGIGDSPLCAGALVSGTDIEAISTRQAIYLLTGQDNMTAELDKDGKYQIKKSGYSYYDYDYAENDSPDTNNNDNNGDDTFFKMLQKAKEKANNISSTPTNQSQSDKPPIAQNDSRYGSTGDGDRYNVPTSSTTSSTAPAKTTSSANTSSAKSNSNTIIQSGPIQDPEQTSDEYIDDVKQGSANDCWLISGLDALSQSQWGRDAIKKAIRKESNGNYTVTLHGRNGTFVHTVTKADIEYARGEGFFSTGDLDVLIIEIATEAYMQQVLGKTELDVIYSQDDDIFELLTGESTQTVYGGFWGSKEELKNTINKFKQNPDKYAICCSIPLGGAGNMGHQCTVSRFETDENGTSYVIIKNPYDISVEIRMTEDEFIKKVDGIYYIENKNYVDNNPRINSDGQVGQVSFAQKGTDKWALPAITAVYSSEPDTIKNNIEYDSNNNLIVTLKGVGKKYTITPAELQRAKESGKYSGGDDDVIALEIAIERLCQYEYGPLDTSSGNLKSRTFNGISLSTIPDSTIIYILTGRQNMHVSPDNNGGYIISDTAYFKDMPPEPVKTERPVVTKNNTEDDPFYRMLKKAKETKGEN